MRDATASINTGLLAPRFDPLDAPALFGIGPVAEGRDQKYFGAVKAWIAALIATNEIASRHRVDLDTTITTLAQTGKDMGAKYKETSEGGLAANLVLC